MSPCVLSAPDRSFILIAAFAILAGAAFPLAAQNRQPISTSLTECSVIYRLVAERGAARGRAQEDVLKVREVARGFFAEAIDQAGAENLPDPLARIDTENTRLEEKWADRFGNIRLLAENKDWIDYCAALGKSRGISLP